MTPVACAAPAQSSPERERNETAEARTARRMGCTIHHEGLAAGARRSAPSVSFAQRSAARRAASVLDRRGLERRAPFLDVDAELHVLAPVPLHQGVAVLLQRVRELLEGQ